MDWTKRILDKLRYKITHLSKFPKGNLPATFHNLAKRGFQPTNIIDVGANHAKWSRDAERVFPSAGYTLIEPQIEMKPFLDRFCHRSSNRRWILGGAGNSNGTLKFTVCPDTVSSNFVTTAEKAQSAGLEQREVPIMTLDQVVDEYQLGIPEIVKIDAEGFETQVLQGSASLVGKTELIFLETHLLDEDGEESGFIELTQLMSTLGYAPYDFTWFGKRPSDGAIGLCEVAYARKNGSLRSAKGWNPQIAKAA